MSVGSQQFENELGFRHPRPLESSTQAKVSLLATASPQYPPVQLPHARFHPLSFSRCQSQLLPVPRPRNPRVLRRDPRRWRWDPLVATFPRRPSQILARSHFETAFPDPSHMGSPHPPLILCSYNYRRRSRPCTVNHGPVARPSSREPSL